MGKLFFSSYKEQTKSRTATDKVPYQQVQNANKNIGTNEEPCKEDEN